MLLGMSILSVVCFSSVSYLVGKTVGYELCEKHSSEAKEFINKYY